MGEFDQDQRGTSLGMGSLFNPVTQLKYQYLSAWSIPTYYAMAKGSLTFSPFYFWSLVPGVKKIPEFFSGTTKSTLQHLLGKSYSGVGNIADDLATTIGLSGKEALAFKGRFTKDLQKQVIKGRWRAFDYKRVHDLIQKHVPTTRLSLMPETMTKAIVGVRKATSVSRIGATVLPLMAGIAVGSMAANLTTLAFKGAIASLNYMDSAIQHSRNLEFGGDMGPGFLSSAAATERQRAVQELQRTPMNGRRFMGREASLYSGLT